MKKLFILIAFLFFATISSAAQDVCPHASGCVTISREAALKALADSDKVKALEVESAAKDKAVADMRAELNAMRIEFAEKSGENTALKQNDVSNRAIIEYLVKNVKKKCQPFSILCL